VPDTSVCVSKFHAANIAAKEQQLRERAESRWEKRMTEHRKYLRSHALKPTIDSYLVKCPAIEERWPQFGADLTLDISEHEPISGKGLRARPNFGAFKGTMLLAHIEKNLDWCKKNTHEPQSTSTDFDDKWAAAVHGMAGDGPVRRVDCALRGQSLVRMDRATYVTAPSLEFNEDRCLTFRGHPGAAAYRRPIGEDEQVEEVAFEGFKVSDTGFKIQRPWKSYPHITVTTI
jgi:hypothetical protein